MWEMRNAYKILVWKPKWKGYQQSLKKKTEMWVWTVFNWLRKGRESMALVIQ
jgi:hypothetical protein